ncbi:PEP-CTERM sorting domain-containing protein [Thermodesulfobacteriota bacterium B35]
MQRLIVAVLCTILAGWSGAASATPVELIENGGFDQGLAGWNRYGDVQVVPAGWYATSILGMEGNFALLGADTGAGLSALWQTFSIQGIDQLEVSFDWTFPYTDLSAHREDTFLSFVRQDGTPVMRLSIMDLQSDGVNWTNHGSFQTILDVSAYTSPDAILAFQLWEQGWWTSSVVGIDNVSVRGTAPVPEPGTMVLFATGLAGIAGVLKKKRRGDGR